MAGPPEPAGAAAPDEIAGGAGWHRSPAPGARGTGLVVAAGAVLLALVVGPGLLSGPAPVPDRRTGQGDAEPASRDARSWTGGATREHGNRFVPSETRLLRLPA